MDYQNIIDNFNKMMGGFPIPSDIKATKNFLYAMEKFIEKKCVISIYPEAHVWPYYSKIRNFVSTSFKYPVKLNKPVFSFTTTYKKRDGRKPKIIVYIDGPFYPNKELNIKRAQEELRDRVYNQMCIRAQNTDVEYYKYEKVEKLIKKNKVVEAQLLYILLAMALGYLVANFIQKIIF